MKFKKKIRKENHTLTDYHSYHLTKKEIMIETGKWSVVCFIFAMLFYKSILAFAVLMFSLKFYLKLAERRKAAERRKELNLQFIQAAKALAAALSAGYSVENAFLESYHDMEHIYPKQTDIMREFHAINRKIQMNITVEDALEDFVKRSGIEDIEDFSDVFSCAKRTGGDLIKIIKNTCQVMEDRLEIDREIDISISGKKYEAGIMNMMPLCMIAYMWLFSADFMAPLYRNPLGIVIMTAALAVYVAAFYVSIKIMDIGGDQC